MDEQDCHRQPLHVQVRREDLEVVKTYYGQLVSAAFWSDDKAKIDRLIEVLETKCPDQ